MIHFTENVKPFRADPAAGPGIDAGFGAGPGRALNVPAINAAGDS